MPCRRRIEGESERCTPCPAEICLRWRTIHAEARRCGGERFGLSTLGVLGQPSFERWTPCQAGRSPIIGPLGPPGCERHRGGAATRCRIRAMHPMSSGSGRTRRPRGGCESLAHPRATHPPGQRVSDSKTRRLKLLYSAYPCPRAKETARPPSGRYCGDATVKHDRGFSGGLIHDVKYRPPFPRPRSRARLRQLL